jgi:hypothetical protein
MRKKISALLILALPLLAFTAMPAFAAKSPVEGRKVDPLLTRIQQYSFPDEHNVVPGEGIQMPKAALGLAAPSALPGPLGVVVGNTWYDNQRNGSMRRMIAWRNGPRLHGVFIRLLDSVFTARKCYYWSYNAATGQPAGARRLRHLFLP